MSEKSGLSLNDLIGIHYKQVDLVHKLWNYMWLAGAAVVTVSLSHKPLASTLLVGFIPFAFANMWLVFGAQEESRVSANAIRSSAEAADNPPPPHVMAVVSQIRPWSPWIALCFHGLVTAFVVAVLRYASSSLR